ncbi:kelch-like protein 9 [Ambystoma mexicanum]|uniref:kelch-like protein 9 n=1 Tax=Ambystoma mexicanum TaxID=8296 RepID=UPI0037E8F8FD
MAAARKGPPSSFLTKGGTRIFSCCRHPSAVLEDFNQLRVQGLLCDVTLLPEDGEGSFPVHRALMASASDYFKAMFTGGMKEENLQTIQLLGVTAAGLRHTIEFIYTAKLSLSMDNLHDVLEAASFLQILPILDFCTELLSSEVTQENCIEVSCIASTYHLGRLEEYVKDFLQRNFSSFLSTREYMKLSADQLAHIFSCNSLKGCSEMELYRAATAWLTQDESHKQYTYKLMSKIRFPLLTAQELVGITQRAGYLHADTACLNLLLEASNYQMLPDMQPMMQSERTAIRSDATQLVTLGGVMRQQLVVSKELRLLDMNTRTWKALQAMDVPRYQHGVAVIGNFLYVVGGQSNYDTKGKTAVDSAFRYDPRFNRWCQLASLNEKRTFFHLSALKGRLYAVGGRNMNGEIDSVECYNPSRNEWAFTSPMSEPHYGHAGTVHGGYMYITGGITHDTFQDRLFRYDPDTEMWCQKADMTTLRGLHCMCTVGDRLYVIGGNHFQGASDYDDVLACEYYSPAQDQWVVVAPMLYGQSDVGVTVLEGKIYVVGGYSWNSRCMVDIVQCYNPESDEWSKVLELPEPLGGIRACTLTVHLPKETVESQTRESPLTPTKKY